jgi:N-acetylglucosaminyldiphosphoundecaprenol N-acetyl-beta-D-mannosaminyltransferase
VIGTISLLGLEFADLDVEAAANWLARRPATAPFGYVTTPNADHLVRLHRRPGLAPLYRDALMCLLDSRVVAGVARLAGLPVPHVAPGSDLTASLLARHVAAGERITIVGLRPEWLPALVARCGIAPPAHYNPPMGFENDASALHATVEFVLTHPARFVFLAVGSPRQEILAAAIAATRRATGVGLCIGASLEFLAGAAQRAPVWVQHASLEWLYRLGKNPRRLARRYLRDCPLVFPMLLHERLHPAAPVIAAALRAAGRATRPGTTNLGSVMRPPNLAHRH